MNTYTEIVRQSCHTHLKDLAGRLPEAKWAVLATADGHVVASTSKLAANTQKESAMASALNGLSLSIARELALGSMESVVVEGSQGSVFCLHVPSEDKEFVLFSLVSAKASYGQALWAVKTTARQLAAALTDLSSKHYVSKSERIL
jgi:predicted regulator of Ras-like GTPase activity (Roadblock/LC7/MglB family)